MKKKGIKVNNKSSDIGNIPAGPPDLDIKTKEFTRRNFLKATGFSMAAVLASCSRAPVDKAIPFLIQPEELVPGKSYWYATTSHSCSAGCAVLVKNRDGRPIKVEGNPDHPITRGGVCTVCQAGILGLYDSKRLFYPMENEVKKSWVQIDKKILAGLENSERDGKEIIILTSSITSPSELEYINLFKEKFKGTKHYEYDSFSYSAILDANRTNYGRRIVPRYRFDKADLIVGFNADFLGTWISPVQFTKDYMRNRDLSSDSISEHIQVESHLTVTGAKADKRILLDPPGIRKLIVDISDTLSGQPAGELAKKLADQLMKKKGRCLVVSGINDYGIQLLINKINHLLNSTSNTIDLDKPQLQFRGNDSSISKIISKLKEGKVGVFMIRGVNPAYDIPEGEIFKHLMKKAGLTISFSSIMNETAKNSDLICPEPHYLESWSDNEFTAGILSMTQPAIKMLKKNRSFRSSLAKWSGYEKKDVDLIRDFWRNKYKKRVESNESFDRWWDKLVHDGYSALTLKELLLHPFKEGRKTQEKKYRDGLSLVSYQSVQQGDGRNSNNPWLHEIPDPIAKITWDNFASVSPKKAEELELKNGDIINISSGGNSIDIPVHIQQGQHDNIVAIAIGYGCLGTERFNKIGPKWIERREFSKNNSPIGINIAPLLKRSGENILYSGIPITLKKTVNKRNLAYTQTYDTLKNPENTAPASMKVREFIQETVFEEYKKDPHSGTHKVHKLKSLWKEDHPYKGHHWGMAIDLSKCTGCSACIVSCQVENNIPVVGRDEVLRRREMHWLRIDRYYSGDNADIDVAFQPMFCQHCDNAPCEPVCPVLATVHSSEGLSQQIYNRCVGTRFCANNCPYKVRRFNWFDYSKNDTLKNMILNPDVTVRSRGVMEKCSMCVQRIQEAKIKAKSAGAKIKDGNIKLACEQSCPAEAIVFGDLNDPGSRISRLIKDPRYYHMLEELNLRPAVGYMTIVRNRDRKEGKKDHG